MCETKDTQDKFSLRQAHLSSKQAQLTAVQVDTPHEANVDTEPTVTAGAFQAHEGSHGQGAGGAAGRRDNEGGPPRLPLGTVGADHVLRLGHQHLEALLELLLGCHGLQCLWGNKFAMRAVLLRWTRTCSLGLCNRNAVEPRLIVAQDVLTFDTDESTASRICRRWRISPKCKLSLTDIDSRLLLPGLDPEKDRDDKNYSDTNKIYVRRREAEGADGTSSNSTKENACEMKPSHR